MTETAVAPEPTLEYESIALDLTPEFDTLVEAFVEQKGYEPPLRGETYPLPVLGLAELLQRVYG